MLLWIKKQKRKRQKYNCWARKMPAVICLIFPFTIFLVIAFSQENVKGGDVAWYLTKAIAWGGAIFTALMFLLKAVIRDFSAMLVDNLFFNGLIRHYMYRILMEKGRGISEASYNRIVTFQRKKTDWYWGRKHRWKGKAEASWGYRFWY